MSLTDNIVSYWKFDEASGNASDSVGSISLTNTGVSYGSGKINNGADAGTSVSVNKTFVGGTPVINLGGSSAKSVAGWFKVNVAPTAFARFLDWRRTAGSGGEFTLGYFQQAGAGTEAFQFYPNGGTMTNHSVVLTVGQWYHLAITCDASNNVKFYIDGTSVKTGTWGTASPGSNFTQFNGANGGTTGNFSGPFSWDEWGAWNKELSAGEVTELVNGGAGKQYPFANPRRIFNIS